MITAFRPGQYDRRIVALAVPALGALAIEPLVSLVDTAFVGRLGSVPLAALAIAAAVFGLSFMLFNFLAYGTTPLVANALGRQDREQAGAITVAALVLGFVLGVAVALLLAAVADPILGVMGARGAVLTGAKTYLMIRLVSLPAVLLMTVGHGAFRGFQDTRTPLVVTAVVALTNLILDPILIFGLDWGIAGAAWASVVAQWLGALWFLALFFLVRRSELAVGRRRPTAAEVTPLLTAGRDLVIRTASLLAVGALATAVAARLGTVEVGAHQVVMQIWLFLALVVDSLAIAAQAMVGLALGEGAGSAPRRISDRLLALGLIAGLVLGALLVVVGRWVPHLFTSEGEVVDAIATIFPFLVLMQPLNALVFVADGIAMGARSFAFLAGSTLLSAVAAAAVLLAVIPLGWGLAGVWWGMTVLMAARAASLWWWYGHGPLAFVPSPSLSSRAV